MSSKNHVSSHKKVAILTGWSRHSMPAERSKKRRILPCAAGRGPRRARFSHGGVEAAALRARVEERPFRAVKSCEQTSVPCAAGPSEAKRSALKRSAQKRRNALKSHLTTSNLPQPAPILTSSCAKLRSTARMELSLKPSHARLRTITTP
jgi:hypothetical protein